MTSSGNFFTSPKLYISINFWGDLSVNYKNLQNLV